MKRFNSNYGHGLYRSRNGVILGVCRGIAEYFDFSIFWARAITVLLMLVTSFLPVIGLYILAALLMKPAPVIPLETEAEQEFYDSYTQSKHAAAQRLKRRYGKLERRIRRMEDIVTAPEFHWEKKYNG